MRISVLGVFEVYDGAGRAIPLGGRRMPIVMARLALGPRRVVPAAGLLEDVWDGRPPNGGAQTLRRLVTRTRARLADYGLGVGPHADGDGYVLDIAPEQVDLHRFTRLAAEGSRMLGAGAADRALGLLDEALSLWQGAPFGGVAAEFANREGARLTQLHLRTVEDRLQALAEIGETERILPELYELCHMHPSRERSHALLIRTLAKDGQTCAALSVYDHLRDALADELDAVPSPELRALHTRLLRGDSAPRRRWMCPYPTRFVGRKAELATLTELMARTRLVTLAGPEGVGKTRLAIEYALRSDAERVCFVDLSVLRPGDNLASAIAAQVGTSEAALVGGGDDRMTRLVAALPTSPSLLLLDSCEHLTSPVSSLAEQVLAACPHVRILLTTREPLNVVGEAVLQVGPLDSSSPRGEAIAMFETLAAVARPGFTSSAADRQCVAEICRRLDGVPLAIELAATWVRSMSVGEIAKHLDEQLGLPDRPRRGDDQGHQTLMGLLDWMWNQLSETEQHLAARLSLLPGGATEADAAALLSGPGPDDSGARRLLSSLVDKSLLYPTEESPGVAARYRLLETPRRYLAQRLGAGGDEPAAIAAADSRFSELATLTSALVLGRNQRQGLAVLDEEHDNLIAALRRMLDRGDASAAFRLGTALGYYWLIRGLRHELVRWADELDGAGHRLDPTSRRVVATVRSALLCRDSAGGCAATAPLQPLDDAVLSAFPLLVPITAAAHTAAGHYEAARADAAAAARHPDPWLRAAGTAAQALVDEACGDVDSAETGIARAVELFRGVGDLWSCTRMAVRLASIQSLRGNADSAVDSLRAAVEMQRSLELHKAVPLTLVRLGEELLRAEQPDAAEATFHEALEATLPSTEVRLLSMVGLADAALDHGDAGRCTRFLAEARALLDPSLADAEYLRIAVVRQEAALALHEDHPVCASELAQQAQRAADRLGDAGTRAEAAELMALTLLRLGEPEQAARMLGAAAGLRGRRDDGSRRARALASELTDTLGARAYTMAYEEGKAHPAAPEPT